VLIAAELRVNQLGRMKRDHYDIENIKYCECITTALISKTSVNAAKGMFTA